MLHVAEFPKIRGMDQFPFFCIVGKKKSINLCFNNTTRGGCGTCCMRLYFRKYEGRIDSHFFWLVEKKNVHIYVSTTRPVAAEVHVECVADTLLNSHFFRKIQTRHMYVTDTCTYTRARKHTNTHAYIHTYMHTYTQLYTHIFTHKRTHIYTQVNIHTSMSTCMHAYMSAYINTYIHTYIRTNINTRIHTYIHMYIHTCIHQYIHTNIYQYIRTCIHTDIHTYINTYIHAYTQTYIQTYVHAYIHTYIHQYIHTCLFHALGRERGQSCRVASPQDLLRRTQLQWPDCCNSLPWFLWLCV